MMILNYILSIFLLILALTKFSNSLNHPFKQCSPRRIAEITSASVNAQCHKEFCTFYKGTDAKLEFKFKLRKPTQRVRAKVIATIGTIDHEFALTKHDVCKQLGCPLKADVTYTYHHGILVSPNYPSVKVNPMRYYLIDGKGRELACLSLPVMIAEQDSSP